MKKSTTGLKYPLCEIKKIAHKWLYLENDGIIDVMIAAHIANQLDTEPLWLLNIGPSSHAKTELLRAFDGHKSTYFLSALTPATLISGQKPTEKSKPSLIFKLTNKTLILKDFTSILSMRHEPRQEVISQLREIHDGQYIKAFGTGNTITWRGKMGLIAACTPIWDKYYSVIGAMGDRFLIYRSNTDDVEKMGMQAQKMVGQERQMRKELKTAFHKFINQLNSMKNVEFKKDDTINRQIVYLACFCASARCPVERDSYTRNIQYQPEPEGPARLTKQFMQLGAALAIAHGKNKIDLEIYEIVKRIGRDLISVQRLKIIRYLWNQRAFEHTNEWRKTSEIAATLNMPVSTIKLTAEDLMTVGALNRKLEDPDKEKSPYLWLISGQIFDWIAKAEVFESST